MTRRHHRDFWHGDLIDESSHDRWEAAGGGTLLERARARLGELQSREPAFALDEDVRATLERLAATPGPAA